MNSKRKITRLSNYKRRAAMEAQRISALRDSKKQAPAPADAQAKETRPGPYERLLDKVRADIAARNQDPQK